MEDLTITYLRIWELMMDTNSDIDIVVQILGINNSDMTAHDVENFDKFMRKYFITKFKERWQKAYRMRARFLEANGNWLQNVYIVRKTTTENEPPNCSNKVKRGRPEIPFEDSQPSTKRKKLRTFSENTSQELIAYAFKKQESKDRLMNAFTPEKALALILDASLTKHQYEVLRSSAKEIGFDIYPSYYQVLETKKNATLQMFK